MVSNDEIKSRLMERKERNGYLVCDNCHGVYELQAGEKPDDFSDECECGGQLYFTKTISKIPMSNHSRNKKIIENGLIIFVVLFCLTIVILPLAYIGMMASISNQNTDVNNGPDYDELATMKANYMALNKEYNRLNPEVDASNDQNTKAAFINTKEDILKVNSDIDDVESALSAGKSQNEITQKIDTAKSQLSIANSSLSKVLAMK